MKHLTGGWPVYEKALLRPMSIALDQYRSVGVSVQTGFELSHLRKLQAHRGPNKVVTLVAHWTEAGVELANGITPVGTIADAVPQEYDGVIDLCVCHPAPLVAALRHGRPGLRAIKFVDTSASLLLWLRLYRALFALIATEDLDAEDAFEGWLTAVIDTARKGERKRWVVRS